MEKIRWGVIGAGGFADRRGIPGLKQAPNAILQALMVRDRSRATELARKHGAPEAYDNVDALLASPAIDAVYICSPVDLHLAHVQAAALAGKHVLCEKPMAASTGECRTMIQVCAQQHVVLGIAYMMRFRPQCVVARQLVDQGRLGRLVSGRAQNDFWYDAPEGAWRLDPAKSQGGALWDIGSHCIDTLRYLMGPVVQVHGMVSTGRITHAVDDTAHALLQFENGAQGMVDCSWAIPFREYPLELYGTQGTLLVTHGLGPYTDARMRLLDAKGVHEIPLPEVNAYAAEFESMGQAILEGREPQVDGWEGLRITEIVLAIYRSSESGEWVQQVEMDRPKNIEM